MGGYCKGRHGGLRFSGGGEGLTGAVMQNRQTCNLYHITSCNCTHRYLPQHMFMPLPRPCSPFRVPCPVLAPCAQLYSCSYPCPLSSQRTLLFPRLNEQ